MIKQLKVNKGRILDQATPPDNVVIDDLPSLATALASLIPISAHMGIKPTHYDGSCLMLTAPLSANINHQQSAFGGSLFSISALAGWSLLQLKLGELGIKANTVIAGGDVGYSAPVYEELSCKITLPENYDEFVDKLKTKGRASLLMTSNICLADDTQAMSFNGKYVVHRTT